MDKVIITAAITGSRPTKEMNPAVPYTPEEIASSAIACYHAGAAIAHIHVRDPLTGAPSSDLDLFREVVERIRSECDMLLNLTTSGLHIQDEDQRLLPVELKPDICSLDIGSVNFQNAAFVNPPDWGIHAAQSMRRAGVKPEIEVFEPGHISQAMDLLEKDLFLDPPLFQLCMGVKWGIEATLENLLFMKGKLPAHAKWSVLGAGSSQLPMITMGILLGGNIRVGFEDSLHVRRGVLAESNAELVSNAVDLVHVLQNEVASVAEARDQLNIPH
jgi:3-keto-5-aminohexanoate cleavage enzyme